MSINNIGFYGDLTKIIFELSSNIIKYVPIKLVRNRIICKEMKQYSDIQITCNSSIIKRKLYLIQCTKPTSVACI